ncbi:hypothetical protein ACOSP7_010875 [Xanthoceras sorbifolium]|uniref:NAC domain-containing protein n=1 Tax=Xanthoceras sorbifolium TaxID=99658 RepID=A0ABQ8HSQ1_9ROSI|nr:hypothetical protein JRO89_XS07G0047900 [Xanthoceras sorbifolium]
MCPPAASPPPDISFACTHEELCFSLEKMMNGFPLPSNVINDVNPYIYMPSNLPDGVWYFVRSKENTDAQHGYWKAKGEACEVFSNSVIIGWRTTLEFHEGQVPHEQKTDWVMQEFRITHKRLCESTKSEDSSSLCRVFLSSEQTPNSEEQQNMSTADTRQNSASKPQVKDDDEKTELAVSEKPANNHVAYLPDSDIISRGDYLELLDLVEPASPSSSSEASSCMTMSSDDCFDPSALLKDLERKINEDKVQDDAGYKYTVSASHRPTEVVMFPGSLLSVERRNSPPPGEIHRTDSSMPDSAIAKGLAAHEGPPSNSHSQNVASSSSSHLPVRKGEKKTASRTKKLKNKYLCFMPF